MRAVVQRVRRAEVRVDGEAVGAIGEGLLVYLAAGRDDASADVSQLAERVAGLRVFPAEGKPLDRSVLDVGGQVLVISQFTLYGDARRGRRPSFVEAMEPVGAERAIEDFIKHLRARGVSTAEGRFRAMMDVESVNWGPVTILMDSKKSF